MHDIVFGAHGSKSGSLSGLRCGMAVQQYWARAAGLYRYVPVREFAQAYKHSKAGEEQARVLKRDFHPYGNADSALAWTKHALTGADLLLPPAFLVHTIRCPGSVS